MILASLVWAGLATGSTLEAVDLRPTDAGVRVVLAGTAPPNFSAFVEARPFRVVVDWAGAPASGLPRQLAVAHPDIERVEVEARLTETEPVTRIAVVLGRAATFELRSEQTEVWIDLDVDPRGLVRAPSADAAPRAEAADRRGRTSEPDGAGADRTSPPSEAWTGDGAPLVEPAVAIPEVAAAPRIPDSEPAPWTGDDWTPPPAEMEPDRAAALAAAQSAPAPRAPPPPARGFEADSADRGARPPTPADAVAVASSVPASSDARPPGPASLDARLPGPASLDARPLGPARQEGRTPSASGAEPPTPPNQRPAAMARAPVGPPPPASAAPAVVAASAPKIEPQPAVLARFDPAAAAVPSTEPPPPSASARAMEEAPARPVVLARFEPGRAAPGGRSAPGSEGVDDAWDPGPHTMTYIGFRQREGISRVFVRLDGRARFRQFQERTTFVLELVNTSVNVENNERPLDTTYFDGPVANVRARPVAGNTRIEVKLRATTPWQIKRIGNTIAIDFEHAELR